MKKRLLCFMLVWVLTGCRHNEPVTDEFLQLRGNMQGKNVQFTAQITADYGDEIYQFSLDCAYTEATGLRFTVKEPVGIQGICGCVTAEKGTLTFDDLALYFHPLADGQLSPISAPWVTMRAMFGGYLVAAGKDGDYNRIALRDSFCESVFTVELWMQEEMPIRSEIYWEGRRILTMNIESFVIL